MKTLPFPVGPPAIALFGSLRRRGEAKEGGKNAPGEPGVWSAEAHLAALAGEGAPLVKTNALAPRKHFRALIEDAPDRSGGRKGARPACEGTLMVKMPVLQALHSLNDTQGSFLAYGQRAFAHFVGTEEGGGCAGRKPVRLA